MTKQSALDLGTSQRGRERARLLHSADWQLGYLPGQLGDVAEEARRIRFQSAARCVELAHEHRVDLVVLAGDTFDSPDLDQPLFLQTLELLAELAPIPVALLPGNHDPLVPGGIWHRRAWQRAGDHVHLLTEEREVEVAGIALYPCPLRQKRSRQDPTDWLPERGADDGRLRIGIAHGALDTLGVASNFPIDSGCVERCGLDYLALGDWHGLSIHGRAAYPGTHEGTSFGEQRPGHLLIVDLQRDAEPEIEAVPVGRLRWHRLDAEVAEASDLAELRARVAELGDLGSVVLRTDLQLRVEDPELRADLEELRRQWQEDAFHLDWGVVEELARETSLPPGLLADLDRMLAEMTDGGDSGLELPDELEASPDVCREARLLLHRLAGQER